MPQFLVDAVGLAPDGRSAVLRGPEAHHLLRVLRARVGDQVVLFDGRGQRWQGRVTALSGFAEARVEELETLPANEPRVEVRLAQSLPKGDRWTWLLEKATELGVSAVAPLRTRFTVAAGGEKTGRTERWSGLVTAAAKQCERAVVPLVEETVSLQEFLRGLRPPSGEEVRLLCLERAGMLPPAREAAPRRVTVAVGPEGGWSAEEVIALRAAGFEDLSLGPRVLRAETAALAALVWVQTRWGDLVGPPHP